MAGDGPAEGGGRRARSAGALARRKLRTQWSRFPSAKEQESTSFEVGVGGRERSAAVRPLPSPPSPRCRADSLPRAFTLGTSPPQSTSAFLAPPAERAADSPPSPGTPSSKSALSTARSPSSTTSSTRPDPPRANRGGTRSSSTRRRRFVELPSFIGSAVWGEEGRELTFATNSSPLLLRQEALRATAALNDKLVRGRKIVVTAAAEQVRRFELWRGMRC